MRRKVFIERILLLVSLGCTFPSFLSKPARAFTQPANMNDGKEERNRNDNGSRKLPDTRDAGTTLLALAISKSRFDNLSTKNAFTIDQLLTTLGTECARLVARATVNEVQACLLADLVSTFNRLNWSPLLVHHVVSRMELSHMPGNIDINAGYELGDCVQLIIRIILARDNKGSYFGPDAGVMETTNGIQDRLQARMTDMTIEVIAE